MNSCLDVYVAPIPENAVLTPVEPPERQLFLQRTRSGPARARRFWVWKLLEHAMAQSLSLSLSDAALRQEGGRWVCDGCFFSLSHSQDAVAVAVSRRPVGVDLEHEGSFLARFSDPERLRAAAKRICAPEELPRIGRAEDLLPLWTKKECLFKARGQGVFHPDRIPADSAPTVTRTVELPERYLLSFCGEALERHRLFLVAL